jgi:N-acetylmuramoyl-L-alanine amidase
MKLEPQPISTKRGTSPVLVEASYISNAFQEKLLACPDKQELEAEAIFLGVVDYLTTSAPPK